MVNNDINLKNRRTSNGAIKSKIYANKRIPYNMMSQEIKGSANELMQELTDICTYYDIYKNGADFTTEGTKGDYVAANQRYKLSKTLIDKEARFLFAEPPDIEIKARGTNKNSEDTDDNIDLVNNLVKNILDDNNFEDILLKAAKDCFIGKRIACLVNFNEEDGVTLSFLPSTQFIYETKPGNTSILTKFVSYIVIKNSLSNKDKRIFKKKYELINGKIYLNESIHDGAGALIEEVLTDSLIELPRIPAIIFVNDGLSGEDSGESEIELLQGYEGWYSKLVNADKDAERKSMNPIIYAIDMESNSTENLSSSAGSFWDLQTNQNLDKPHPQVGNLESNMSYSESLKTTLDRIKNFSYELLDMPQINPETMTGIITSGKALHSIYWGLIVRCKEKMKTWGPGLREVIEIIIEGVIAFPNTVAKHTDQIIMPIDYEVTITQNFPLPEDETEEKNMDLSEVESKTMSRKTYMKKWYKMTDEEIEKELEQIGLERELLEDSSFMPSMDISDLGIGGIIEEELEEPLEEGIDEAL